MLKAKSSGCQSLRTLKVGRNRQIFFGALTRAETA
jgi:hypothetical protein